MSICNLALAQIGRGASITALDESSQAARSCKARYPYARDAVLRSYDWNFAAKRASLAANATAPSFEFTNAFDLPTDCLQVRSVYLGESLMWVVENDQILTNIGAPLQVKYTALVTDTSKFDPLFVDALAARIAADIAIALSESVARAQALMEVFKQKIIEARRRDAQEGQPENLPRGSWTDARQSGDWNGINGWPDDQ